MKSPAYLEYMRSGDFGALFRRTFVSICVGILLPLTLVCIGLFAYLNGIYNDELRSMGSASLQRIAGMADTVQTGIEAITVNLASDKEIVEFIETPSAEAKKKYAFYKLTGRIMEKLNKLNDAYMGTIYVCSYRNGYAVTSGGETMQHNIMEDGGWLVCGLGGGSELAWTDGRVRGDGSSIITSYHKVPTEWPRHPDGLIAINTSAEWLDMLVADSTDSEFSDFYDFYILDDDETVLYNRDCTKLGQRYMDIAFDNGTTEVRVLSAETGRIYVARSSFDGISGRVWLLWALFAAMLVLCAGVAIGVSYVISVRVFKPVRSIIKLKESHFELLQAQINPHFLYNALQTISFQAMSLTRSDNACSRSIIRLSALFRSMTDVGGESDIGREAAFAAEYLDIVTSAREGQFETSVDVPQKLARVRIPKLSIQPLAENCIKHAFARPAKPPFRISIRARAEGRDVVVTVSDNGVGRAEDWIRSANAAFARCDDSEGGKSIGLRNVNARVRLTRGKGYGVYVSRGEESDETGAAPGFTVSIRLPYETEEQI